MKWLLLALLACAAAARAQNTNDVPGAGSPGGGRSDWETRQQERDWREGEIRLPPYPGEAGLIEFSVSNVTSFRFFIDPASLSLGKDGVVRYTLVARSPSGYRNISYEGIRCANGSYKVFAIGNDGRWSIRESDWREIEPKTVQRWHNELRWQYFCPNRGSILTAEEGLDALRRGKHPGAAARAGY